MLKENYTNHRKVWLSRNTFRVQIFPSNWLQTSVLGGQKDRYTLHDNGSKQCGPGGLWQCKELGLDRVNVMSVDKENYNDQTVKIWAKSDDPFKSYEFSKFWFTPLMGSLSWQPTGTKWLPTWRTLHSLCTQNFTFSSFCRKVDKTLLFCSSIIWTYWFCIHFGMNLVDSLSTFL